MRVVYLGTPEFVVPPLQTLLAAGHEVVAVVTPPDRPAGRGRQSTPPPLAEAALRLGLPLYQPERASSPEFRATLAELGCDVAVTAAYGQYLTTAFLALPRHGVLNIHPSLLPRWRGASPVVSALLAGEARTGVSVLRSTRTMDAGPLLAQQQVLVEAGETAGELTARLFVLGGELLAEVLARLARGEAPAERAQDEAGVTLSARITGEQAELYWQRPAQALAWQVQAFHPTPVAWTRLDGKRLRIWRATAAEASGDLPTELPAGTLLGPPQRAVPQVVCGRGVLLLEEVQLEGSRRLAAGEFWRGLRRERVQLG